MVDRLVVSVGWVSKDLVRVWELDLVRVWKLDWLAADFGWVG